MKRLFAFLVLVLACTIYSFGQASCVSTATSFGFTSPVCPAVTTSGSTITVYNSVGTFNGTFEEIFTGSPATASVTITGYSKGGTSSGVLDTNTSTTSAIRYANSTTAVYSYYVITATWTGGTNVTFQLNPTLSTARNGGAGGGGSGTVTSVGFVGDGIFDSSTPSTAVTVSGNVAATANTQAPNCVFAGPATGSTNLAPSCRSLVALDIPSLSYANLTLANLGTTAINAALLPGTSNSIALGATGSRWTNLFSTALNCGIAGTTGCVLSMNGATSGASTLTAPAIAGTASNPIAVSNSMAGPDNTSALLPVWGFSDSATSGLGEAGAGVVILGGASVIDFYINSAEKWTITNGGNFTSTAAGGHYGSSATGNDRVGTCTMSSGACTAITFTTAYTSAPACQVSWSGSGTLTGLLSYNSTTTGLQPKSSVNTDTAVVAWLCFGNPF